MNLRTGLIGLLSLALVSVPAQAEVDALKLGGRLAFGTASSPTRLELGLQSSLRLAFGQEDADERSVVPVSAPLWSASLRQGQWTDVEVLGIAQRTAVEQHRLDAEGSATWIWVGLGTLGLLALVAAAAGGGGGDRNTNSRPNGSGGPDAEVADCQVLDTDLNDPTSPTIIGGNCNLGGG